MLYQQCLDEEQTLLSRDNSSHESYRRRRTRWSDCHLGRAQPASPCLGEASTAEGLGLGCHPVFSFPRALAEARRPGETRGSRGLVPGSGHSSSELLPTQRLRRPPTPPPPLPAPGRGVPAPPPLACWSSAFPRVTRHAFPRVTSRPLGAEGMEGCGTCRAAPGQGADSRRLWTMATSRSQELCSALVTIPGPRPRRI